MKRIIALGLVVLAVVLVWSGAWFYAATQIRSYVGMMAEADGITNPKITCADLSVGGFPFRFDVACRGMEVASGDVTTTMAELRGSALAYNPFFLRFWARGPVELSDAFTGSKSTVTFTNLEASARFNVFRIERISVIADTLDWTDALFNAPIAKAARAEAHLIDIPEQHQTDLGLTALSQYVTATGVDIPGLALLDGTVTLESELSGVPDDVRRFAEPDAIARFRDARGQLTLVSLRGEASEGQDFIDASGNAGLDDQGRLEGQIALKSRGLVERLDGLFDPNMRPLIAGSPAADGSYANTLNIRAGVFVSGVVPLFVIPPLL